MSQAWVKGLALPEVVCGPITREDLVRYAEASGDHNPIHTNEVFALEAGLGGVIAHGMLTMAYVGKMVSDFAGTEADLEELSVRFRAMVRPGDHITCRGFIQELTEGAQGNFAKLQVLAENERGEAVVKGTARLRRG